MSKRNGISAPGSKLLNRAIALRRSDFGAQLRHNRHASSASLGSRSSIMSRNTGHSPGRTPDCTRSARALRRCRRRDSLSRSVGAGSGIAATISESCASASTSLSAASASSRLSSSARALMRCGIASALRKPPSAITTPGNGPLLSMSDISSRNTRGSRRSPKARAAALMTASSPRRSTGSAMSGDDSRNSISVLYAPSDASASTALRRVWKSPLGSRSKSSSCRGGMASLPRAIVSATPRSPSCSDRSASIASERRLRFVDKFLSSSADVGVCEVGGARHLISRRVVDGRRSAIDEIGSRALRDADTGPDSRVTPVVANDPQ